MRPRFYILLVAISLTLIFLITRIVAFINIFFTHSGIALTQREILNAHRQSPSELRTQYVPKIIHQVYHDWSGGNGSMPSDWVGVRRTCVDLNPGWEYKVIISYCESEMTADTERVVVMDAGDFSRFHCKRIPLVSRNLQRIQIPRPKSRHGAIFPPAALWRHLPRPRQRKSHPKQTMLSHP